MYATVLFVGFLCFSESVFFCLTDSEILELLKNSGTNHSMQVCLCSDPSLCLCCFLTCASFDLFLSLPVQFVSLLLSVITSLFYFPLLQETIGKYILIESYFMRESLSKVGG